MIFHSPSLAVGHTPYVRNDKDLGIFLLTLEHYLSYFLTDVGGRPTTPSELFSALQASA